VPALLCSASSAVLADSAAKYGEPLGDSLGSGLNTSKSDSNNVSRGFVDDTATSSSSFSQMFGDLARQSEAPNKVLPDPTLSADAESAAAQPISTDSKANQSVSRLTRPPATADSVGSKARESGPLTAQSQPMAPFSSNRKARVLGAPGKQAAPSPSPLNQSGIDSTTNQTANAQSSRAQSSAPPAPFSHPPSATLDDNAGGNQYLRQVATLIPNVQMTAPNIVRGSQPTGQTLALLKSGGVTTVINLRNEDVLVAQEGIMAKRLGLNYVNIPMNIFDVPSKQQITDFLAAISKARGKVFVHCQHGQDRTGTMIGMYRIAHDGWDAKRAYQEMLSCGFRPYLGNLTEGVYEFSASMGRPVARPALNLSDMFSHFHF